MFSIQGFLTWHSKLLMTYKHLSQAERYQIHALMKAGHDQSQIAKLLDRYKRSGSAKLNRSDKCIIGVFSLGKGAGAGDHYEQIIWAANPTRV
jgi:hypothetical protein